MRMQCKQCDSGLFMESCTCSSSKAFRSVRFQMMKKRQTRDDWNLTITSLEEFCRSKRQKLAANDWIDSLPDAGVQEEEEVCSTSSPGGGVCPPPGPSASASSKGKEVPPSFPTASQVDEECPRPKRLRAHVTIPLCDTVCRELSHHRNGT